MKCKFCKKEFTPIKPDEKFCSKECMWASRQVQYLIQKGEYTSTELKHITNPEEVPLSEAQENFVYEYIKTKNIVKSMKLAFPDLASELADRELYRKGTYLLKMPFVKAYIKEVLDELQNRFISDKFGALIVLDTIINTPITEFLNPDGSIKAPNEIDVDSAKAIKKIKRKYHKDGSIMEEELELEPKLQAINLIGKYYDLFTDRKEVDVKVTHLLDIIKKEDPEFDVDVLIQQTRQAIESKVEAKHKEFEEQVKAELKEYIDAEVEDE